MGTESRMSTARHAFVESGRAIGRALGEDDHALGEFRALWEEMEVVEITQLLCERALDLALDHSLRTLDAIHLAAAVRLDAPDLAFATWDRDLWRAAQAEGFNVLPEARP